MMITHSKEVDTLGGHQTLTNTPQTQAQSSADTAKIIDFKPMSEENSILYTSVNIQSFNRSDIEVHPDCPPSIVKYIQYRVQVTIPVLNWLYPNDPCWKHLGKTPDGYARHNPRRFKNLPEEAQNCSTILSRFIYRWIKHPEGISRKYDVDHMCGRGTNGCINPRHLQLLTPEVNRSLGNRDIFKP